VYEIRVNGTLIWYYFICKRQVWLMSHGLEPNQDDSNIILGRFIHENSYLRNKKEVSVGNIKIDVLNKKDGQVVLGEIKKSSKFIESAKMQLSYYLLELKRHGLVGKGVLMIPKEKKRIEVELTKELEDKLRAIEEDIIRLVQREKPIPAARIKFCKTCAYSEFCWS